MPQSLLERLKNKDNKKGSLLDRLKSSNVNTAEPELEEEEEVETTDPVLDIPSPDEVAKSQLNKELQRGGEQILKQEDDKYKAPARHMREYESWGSNFIPPEDGKQGIVGAFGTGLARGAATTLTGTVSGALQAAGDLPGMPEGAEIPGMAASELNKYVQRGLSVERNKEDDWGAYWADVAGAGIGSMTAFLAGGLGAKAIKLSGAAGGAALEAIVAGANAYDAAKEGGASPLEAAKAAAEVSATTAASSYGVGKVGVFSDAIKNPIVKGGLSAVLEGGQETLQGVGEQAATRHYDPNFKAENLSEGWVENFVGGFVGGGALGTAVGVATKWGQDPDTGLPTPYVTETTEEAEPVDQTPRAVTKEEAQKVFEGLMAASEQLTGAKKQQVLDEANKWKEFNERKPQEQLNLDHMEPVPVVDGRNEGMVVNDGIEDLTIEVPPDISNQFEPMGNRLSEDIEAELELDRVLRPELQNPERQAQLQAELDARNAPRYGEGDPYVDPLFAEDALVGPPAPTEEQLELDLLDAPIEKEYPTGQIPFTNEESLELERQRLAARQPVVEEALPELDETQLELDIPQTRYELAGSEESWFRSPNKQQLKAKFQGLVDQANAQAEPNPYYVESIIVDPDGTEYYLPGDVTEHLALLRHFGYTDVMDAVADGWVTYSKNQSGSVNIRFDPTEEVSARVATDIIQSTPDVDNVNGLPPNDLSRIYTSMDKELVANLKWLQANDKEVKQLWPKDTPEIPTTAEPETPVRHPLEVEIQEFMGPEMEDAYISVVGDIKLADDYPFRGPVSATLTPGQAKRVAQVARYLYDIEGADPYEAVRRAKAFVTGEGDSRSSIEQSISAEFDETDADLLEYPTEEGFEDLDDLQDLKHTLGSRQLPAELTGPIEEPVYEIEPWDITRPPVRGQGPTAQEQEYVKSIAASKQTAPSTFPEPILPGDRIGGNPKSIDPNKWAVPEQEAELPEQEVELPDPFAEWEDPAQIEAYTEQDLLFDPEEAAMPPTREATQQSLMSPGALQFPPEYPSVTGTTVEVLGQPVDLGNVSESLANAFKYIAESNTPESATPDGDETGLEPPTEQLTVTEGSKNFMLPLHTRIERKGTLGEKISDQLEAVRVRANIVLGELTDLYIKAPLKKLKWENQIKVGQLLNGADQDSVLADVESEATRNQILEATTTLRTAYDRVADLYKGLGVQTRKKAGKHLTPNESVQQGDESIGGLFQRIPDYFPRLLYSGETYGNVKKIIATQGQKGLTKIGEEVLYNMQTQYGIPEEQARKALAQWIEWRSTQTMFEEGQEAHQAMVAQFPDMIEVLESLSDARMNAVDIAEFLNKNYRSASSINAPMFGSIEAVRTLDVSPFADPNPLRVSDKYFNRAAQRFGEIKQLGQFNERLEELFAQTGEGSVPPELLKNLADDIKLYLYDDEKAADFSKTMTWIMRIQTSKLKLAWIGNMLQSLQNARVVGVRNTLGAYWDLRNWDKARTDARQAGATADIDMRPTADLLTMGEGGVKQSARQVARDLTTGAGHRVVGDLITGYAATNSVMHRETELWNRLISTQAGIRLAQKMATALNSGDTKQIERVKRDLEMLQVPYELVEEYGTDSREFELMIGEAVNRTVNFTSDKLSRPAFLTKNQGLQVLTQFKSYMYGMQDILRKNFNNGIAAAKAGDYERANEILVTELAYLFAVLPATGITIGWFRNLVYDLAETAWGETLGDGNYEATRLEEYEDKVSELWEENLGYLILTGAIESASLGLIFSAIENYNYKDVEGIAAGLAGPGIMSGLEAGANVYEGGKETLEADTAEEAVETGMFHVAKTVAEGLDGIVKMFAWDPYAENKDE